LHKSGEYAFIFINILIAFPHNDISRFDMSQKSNGLYIARVALSVLISVCFPRNYVDCGSGSWGKAFVISTSESSPEIENTARLLGFQPVVVNAIQPLTDVFRSAPDMAMHCFPARQIKPCTAIFFHCPPLLALYWLAFLLSVLMIGHTGDLYTNVVGKIYDTVWVWELAFPGE